VSAHRSPLAAAALAMRSESRPAERQCMPAQATMQVLVSPDRIAYHIPDKERSRRSSNGSSCLLTRLQRICVSALRLIDCQDAGLPLATSVIRGVRS